MHPMLFECWWRGETARVEQRAKMAAAREARLRPPEVGPSQALDQGFVL
jgi:hypothetical protein